MKPTKQNISTQITANIDPSWKIVLNQQFKSQYFIDLKYFLIDEYRNHVVYPKKNELFNAFIKSPFNKVKVILLGQDPYHRKDQAHGLSFSVQKKVQIPPSLRNIYKELEQDLKTPTPNHGNLTSWAEQGVLLLNTTLSVREGEPLSHQKKGWEKFTDAAISELSNQKSNLVFLLWGAHARTKKKLIDTNKHKILEAPHPSPLSAHLGYLGCKHFSLTNNYLISKNINPINWKIK